MSRFAGLLVGSSGTETVVVQDHPLHYDVSGSYVFGDKAKNNNLELRV